MGENFVRLTHDRLDVGECSALAACDSTGAVSLFVGTTRNHFDGKKVVRLEYEAYEGMATKVMEKLCEEVRSRWPGVSNVVVHHRLGPVGLREASVVIAISSEHRKDSLEAVTFAINELKALVPIWKKEVYGGEGDGEGSAWKQNQECKWSEKKEAEEEEEEGGVVDPSLVQITASKEELDKRMKAFMERKRDELDRNNVLEFCNRAVEDGGDEESSCARVDSVLPSRAAGAATSDRSGHIRNSQVSNPVGPQTTSDYLDRRFDPLEHSMKAKKTKLEAEAGQGADLPSAIRERVLSLESKVRLEEGKPVPRDVYERIRALEDRVRYLEGVSPEYFTPSGSKNGGGDGPGGDGEANSRTVQDSLTSINTRIQELQESLRSKQQSSKNS